MIYGLHTKSKVAERWKTIKTNMSKAYDYDCVEWIFLETLIARTDFGRIWKMWFIDCGVCELSILPGGFEWEFT